MTHLALKDELLDAQLLRTVGSSPYGGADIGECLATAALVDGTDLTSWHDAWVSTGDRVAALAAAALAAGRVETARAAFFRASSYFRTAGVMLMAAPVDPRLVATNTRQTEVFRQGATLLAHPPEILDIPYETTTLPGYFFPAVADGRPRPTVVLLGGYDGTAEELYFFNGAAALARGYNVLAFDGPGQGAALLQQGLVLRPDFENVLSPVLDYLGSRDDVDPDRVGLIGLSLGAHLAPRAVSAEHRIAACVADCGSYDLFESGLERIPKRLASGLVDGHRVSTAVLRQILRVLAAKPTAGWALRRGQLVHGTDDPLDYLLALREYSLKGRAEAISYPTFVCNAEGDDISTSAPRLFDALIVEKEFVAFGAAEGAGDHCEVGARLLYHARSFGWLDRMMGPGSSDGRFAFRPRPADGHPAPRDPPSLPRRTFVAAAAGYSSTTRSPSEEDAVSGIDKAKDKVQVAKGHAKESAGKALDDPALEGEGKADKVVGNLKQAGEKVKDAVKR